MTTNKNLLSPNKFRVIISKFPNLEIFAQACVIPGINLGIVPQYTNEKYDLWIPGDKLTFDDLIISCIIDEDLTAYNQLKTWAYDISISENKRQQYSDIDCIVGTNNSNPNKIFRFYNSFPYLIPSFAMDTRTTEDDVLSLDILFKISNFDLLDVI